MSEEGSVVRLAISNRIDQAIPIKKNLYMYLSIKKYNQVRNTHDILIYKTACLLLKMGEFIYQSGRWYQMWYLEICVLISYHSHRGQKLMKGTLILEKSHVFSHLITF